MLTQLKTFADSAIEAHPLLKGAAGGAGGFISWLSTHVHMIDPIVKGIAFYGGALVVLLSLACWSVDLYRKWWPRKD